MWDQGNSWSGGRSRHKSRGMESQRKGSWCRSGTGVWRTAGSGQGWLHRLIKGEAGNQWGVHTEPIRELEVTGMLTRELGLQATGATEGRRRSPWMTEQVYKRVSIETITVLQLKSYWLLAHYYFIKKKYFKMQWQKSMRLIWVQGHICIL